MLIGITGYAQHGKDTVGAYLVGTHGFTQTTFAGPLKALAYRINPIVVVYGAPRNEVLRLQDVIAELGEEEAKKLPEVRRFYQELGTQARIVLGEDVWVDAWQRTYYSLAPDRDVVVTDVRFPNEAFRIAELGGELWRVERPGFDNGIGTTHLSEQYVEGLRVDKRFVNGSTIEHLHELAESAYQGAVLREGTYAGYGEQPW